MGKRFLIIFALIFGYIIIPTLVLMIIVFASGGGEEVSIAAAVGAVILALGFFPFMLWSIKRVFTFRAEAEPVSEQALQDVLLSINTKDMPLIVEQRGPHHLVATQRYVDAKWWTIFAREGLTQVYELHMKFDPSKQRVRMIDIHRRVDWRAGPQQVKLHASFSRGIMMQWERAVQWGITDQGTLGKHYNYAFSSQKIKGPFMDTILEHGWDIQFALW